jgi:hypothetical protein
MCLSGCAGRDALARLGIEGLPALKAGAGAAQDQQAGAPTMRWLDTYAPVGNRRAALVQLQQRLGKVVRDDRRYLYAKAQCWIDAGQQALDARDQWGFVEEAIGEGATITASLESGRPLPTADTALRTVTAVRPDLWKIAAAIRHGPVFAGCPDAQPPLACAEVKLTQAGHDAWTRDFPAAEETVSTAIGQLAQSANSALLCVTHGKGREDKESTNPRSGGIG